MRVALDTNFLVYAEGVNGPDKKQAALDTLVKLRVAERVIPLQVLGELFYVLARKTGRSAARAQETVQAWQDMATLAETSFTTFASALHLATDHRLGIWDSIVLAAAAESECRLLLSEDLHHGFTWAGVTVCNPFTPPGQALLQSFLTE
jgi:predicted nucleic acid-binding protein